MFNAQALQRIRSERGLSQAALAKKVGVVQSAISQFESGAVQPAIDTLERLADALNVPVSELLTSQADKTREEQPQ